MSKRKRRYYFRIMGDDLHGSASKDAMLDVPGTWPIYCAMLLHQGWFGGLPPSKAAIARKIGVTPAAMTKAWPLISPKFTVVEGELRNPRMEAERDASRAFTDGQAERGFEGARRRHGCSDASSDASSYATPLAASVAIGVGVSTPKPKPKPNTLARSVQGSHPPSGWTAGPSARAGGVAERAPGLESPDDDVAAACAGFLAALQRFEPSERHGPAATWDEPTRLMLAQDGRTVGSIVDLASRLYGGEYQPEGAFDRRRRVRCPGHLRAQWGAIEADLKAQNASTSARGSDVCSGCGQRAASVAHDYDAAAMKCPHGLAWVRLATCTRSCCGHVTVTRLDGSACHFCTSSGDVPSADDMRTWLAEATAKLRFDHVASESES